jgi:sulfide:quinone oxidoreductase
VTVAPPALQHRFVIVGGGSAGITVAARLRRAGETDIALVEPSATHYYQPLWTLVGAGAVDPRSTARAEARVVPKGVRWIQDAAVEIDAERRRVTTSTGVRIAYDFLVVAVGLQLDWGATEGLADAIARGDVTSNYRFDLAPRTFELLEAFSGGTALFTGAVGPIKCGGAAQKAAYLSADLLQHRGVLPATNLVLASPTEAIFGIPEFARPLEHVVERYGIDSRFRHELVEVRGERREAVFVVRTDSGEDRETIPYGLLHVVPRQSAPDFLKCEPLAIPDAADGLVDVDAETLQHRRFPEVFALGDCSGAPNAKTGAAVRKQAPVVVRNIRDVAAGREPSARYDGYSSCPIVTSRGTVVLAEFDYSGRPHPTIPFVNTARERRDMWLLKRYGLPWLYWNLMLRGLA